MATQHLGRFLNKTAVVTGSSEGIGFAIARRFAQEGAYVVISSRTPEKVDKALATLHSEGLKNVSGFVCDVTSDKDQEALLKHTLEKRSGIDILVSNAGKVFITPILETTASQWDDSANINLKSHLFLTQKFAPEIQKQGKGAIIYISSMAGYLPGFNIYGLAKAALINLTKTVALTLGPQNVRVNAIAPGIIETNMTTPLMVNPQIREKYEALTTLKRFGKPEEIAGIAAFLASDDASYVTGEVIVAAGGTFTRP